MPAALMTFAAHSSMTAPTLMSSSWSLTLFWNTTLAGGGIVFSQRRRVFRRTFGTCENSCACLRLVLLQSAVMAMRSRSLSVSNGLARR
jgi:hypothetical protein